MAALAPVEVPETTSTGPVATADELAELRRVTQELIEAARVVTASNEVYDLVPVDGGLWTGTNDGVAFRSDDNDWTVWNTHNSDLPHNGVYSLAPADGGLWVGTVGGGDLFTVRNDTGPDGANHDFDGVFILSGDGLEPQGEVFGSTIYDVAPTLLELLGVEGPNDFVGRSLIAPRR